jgi:hypothetical protein
MLTREPPCGRARGSLDRHATSIVAAYVRGRRQIIHLAPAAPPGGHGRQADGSGSGMTKPKAVTNRDFNMSVNRLYWKESLSLRSMEASRTGSSVALDGRM